MTTIAPSFPKGPKLAPVKDLKTSYGSKYSSQLSILPSEDVRETNYHLPSSLIKKEHFNTQQVEKTISK